MIRCCIQLTFDLRLISMLHTSQPLGLANFAHMWMFFLIYYYEEALNDEPLVYLKRTVNIYMEDHICMNVVEKYIV